jgi:hypothetical protein
VPIVTLVLLASVLPFGLPLQNLRARNGNDLCRELLEALERRFELLGLGFWHEYHVISRP